jgi:hypothetical protein
MIMFNVAKNDIYINQGTNTRLEFVVKDVNGALAPIAGYGGRMRLALRNASGVLVANWDSLVTIDSITSKVVVTLLPSSTFNINVSMEELCCYYQVQIYSGGSVYHIYDGNFVIRKSIFYTDIPPDGGNLTFIDGGSPTSVDVIVIDGGSPTSIDTVTIDGGSPTSIDG